MSRRKRTKRTGDVIATRIREYETALRLGRPAKMSTWIRRNRPLLVMGGALAAGAGKAIAWIVSHVDDISECGRAISSLFRSRSPRPAVSKCALTIDGEPLEQALCGDVVLMHAVVKEIRGRRGVPGVSSEHDAHPWSN